MSMQEARYRLERRILQILTACIAIFPVTLGSTIALTGLDGFSIVFGIGEIPGASATLDSAVRFLAANFFGMGLVMLWVLPKVERQTAVYRIIVFTILFGATARCISLLSFGSPNTMTLVLIGIESSAVVLALLQYKVARFYKTCLDPQRPSSEIT